MRTIIDGFREVALTHTTTNVSSGILLSDRVGLPLDLRPANIHVLENRGYRGTLRAGTTWTTVGTLDMDIPGATLIPLGVGIISSRPLLYLSAPEVLTENVEDNEEDEEGDNG